MAAVNCTELRLREDRAIYRAIRIIEKRMRTPGAKMLDPKAVIDWLRLNIANHEHEVFVGIFIDSQHQLIECVELSRGTLNSAIVYPREVMKIALRLNAAAVILAHNHPSGNLDPSESDRQLTVRLRDVLKLVEIRVLDHVIVGGQSLPVSFAARGWI